MKKNAAIYCRVSTEAQAREVYSLGEQLEKLKDKQTRLKEAYLNKVIEKYITYGIINEIFLEEEVYEYS